MLSRLVLAGALFVGPSVAYAQDCGSMSLFHEGAHQVRASYDAKGKETGRTSMDVTSLTTQGTAITAAVHSVTTDAKGKEAGAVDYTVVCDGGELRFDMKAMVPSDTTKAYEDFEMTIEGTEFSYPASMSAGQTLPDGTLTMTFTMQGAPAMIPPTVMTFLAKNRLVVGPEPITTPAGAFDTWKLTYDFTVTMKGMVASTNEMSTVEWYVPGVGAVKSEVWSRGKLQGTTVLVETR